MTKLSIAALAAWLYLTFLHGMFWRVRNMQPKPQTTDLPPRRIAVVIPARNEAATIGAAVASLVGQQWPGPFHIWVVNDNSTDGTAELARRDGVSVVQAGSLPPGWTGKVWAMSRGVEHALSFEPDYVLLTDADIVHEAWSVPTLVASAGTESLDMTSVMVHLNCRSLAERLLVPAFVFFFFMLYPPKWIADRRRAMAGAAGGCILVRPSALDRISGLASIRGELIDDCALAHRVKSTGGAIRLAMSGAARSVRLYPTLSDIRRMISRTAFTQLRYSPVLLAGTIAGMLFLYGVPVVATLMGTPWGALAWILSALLYLPMLRAYRQPAASAVLLPFVAAFYLYATVESAVRYWSGRGGAWKGRNQAPSVT